MFYVLNKSPRTLSKEVYNCLGITQKNLVRRPFNHYTPTMTNWYIIPSAELPFFKFTKYWFNWDEADCKEIFCGVIVTKGLDSELAVVYNSKKGRRYIMDNSWGFHKIVNFFNNEEMKNIATKISQEFNSETLRIIVKGGYIDDPGVFDPYLEKRPQDIYYLDYDVANDKIKVIKAERKAMTLKVLNKVCNFKTLVTALNDLKDNNFLWCDIAIGINFKIIQDSDTEELKMVGLSGEMVAQKLFRHLEILL